MFHTTHTGFTMTFSNGVKASVQWGPGNYCASSGYGEQWHSKTAEVAAWDRDGNWITRNLATKPIHDDVVGWLTPDEVAGFILACASYDATRALPAPLFSDDEKDW